MKKNEAREELNKAIKEEVLLRCAAGELLQRVSATHRQCETDLRKLLVHMKMKSLADIIDINSPYRNDNLPPIVIVVDIEKVSALSQPDLTAARREQFRKSHMEKNYNWQSVIRSWGDSFATVGPPSLPTSPSSYHPDATPRMRRKSMQNLLFSVQLQQLSTSFDTDETSIRASMSLGVMSPVVHEQDDDCTITRQSVMEFIENHSSSFRSHSKKMYATQECDTIRKTIKAELERQLQCATDGKPHEGALIPVLHALNGYVCGRLSGQEKTAVCAYSTGALGDQVRIMRALLSIYLSFLKDRDSQDSGGIRALVSTDISDANGLMDYLHSLSYSDGESRHILTSLQVLEFLHWASSIGDIIGLQAIRFMTELIHRCLSKRMAQRCLEQTENLPAQSFGDNVLNEFKREVTHGIYSRRR